MMKPIIKLFILLLFVVTGGEATVPPLPSDRSPIMVRRPDAATWERLYNDRAYQYGQDIQPADSFLGQLLMRFLRWIKDWLYNPEFETTRDWLTIALVVGVAVFVAFKLLGMDKMGLWRRGAAESQVPYSLETDNIHAIAFDEEIATARSREQFRLAVRLYYLKTLKTLTDQALIDWQPNKTNRAYVDELKPKTLRPDFERITAQFEYVWYGGFPLESAQFEGIRRGFEAFEQTLSAVRR
ncbi:MAG: DUF4129 domain-containing protein [Cytophagaceae bacterium]|nr:DUF4129 domain-containing protein [Cytophagaceae bacterium]